MGRKHRQERGQGYGHGGQGQGRYDGGRGHAHAHRHGMHMTHKRSGPEMIDDAMEIIRRSLTRDAAFAAVHRAAFDMAAAMPEIRTADCETAIRYADDVWRRMAKFMWEARRIPVAETGFVDVLYHTKPPLRDLLPAPRVNRDIRMSRNAA